jgi:hypothetical protein
MRTLGKYSPAILFQNKIIDEMKEGTKKGFHFFVELNEFSLEEKIQNIWLFCRKSKLNQD